MPVYRSKDISTERQPPAAAPAAPAAPAAGEKVRRALASRLSSAGFVAGDDEARELIAAAAGDERALERLVERRLAGEPLAWVTGSAVFDGLVLRVHSGVYVPRWQSVALARRAAARLPGGGAAIDVCTGSGAIALSLARARPHARVVATDLDPRAVACAQDNGVDAHRGDLLDPVPPELVGATDVVVAVVPYVPTPALELLPRDTLRFEDRTHYDGGPDGTELLARLAKDATRVLRPGGSLLVELGGNQAALLGTHLRRLGFGHTDTWSDDDGDLRGMEAVFAFS